MAGKVLWLLAQELLAQELEKQLAGHASDAIEDSDDEKGARVIRECRQWGQVKLRGTKRVRGDEVY